MEELENHKKEFENLDIQIKELQNKLLIKEKEKQELHEQVLKLTFNLQNFEQQNNDLKNQLNKTEQKLQSFLDKNSNEELNEEEQLQYQLTHLKVVSII